MRVELLELLRCPACGGGLQAEDPSAVLRFGPVRCTECEAIYPVADGILDLLAGDAPERLSLAQRSMERPAVARLYERGLRKHLARFPLESREEAFLYSALLAPAAGEPLVDLSCGTGVFSRALSQRPGLGPILSLDRSHAMLEEAQHRGSEAGIELQLVRCDAHDLPLRDASVGGVLCAASLHLYRDPAAALAEVRRILVPGRHVVVSTFLESKAPALGPLEARAGIHRWSADDLRHLCEEVGLEAFESLRLSPWIVFRATRPAA